MTSERQNHVDAYSYKTFDVIKNITASFPSRINFIALTSGCQKRNMMDVDKVFAQLTVGFFEIESTALADVTIRRIQDFLASGFLS